MMTPPLRTASVAWCLGAGALVLCACFEARRIEGEAPSEEGPVAMRHEKCDVGLDARHLSEAFETRPSALNASRFNYFAQVDCALLEPLPRCDHEQPCPFFANCITPEPGEPGYCVSTTSEPTLLGSQGGTCHHAVRHDDKAALCCAAPQGFDCRTIPFESAGGPGMFCTNTGDCETGLVCRAFGEDTDTALLGTCQCPEAVGTTQGDPDLCERSSSPEWGQPVEPGTAGACRAALAPGYVEEVIETTWPSYGATLDKAAFPYVIRAPSGAAAILARGRENVELVAQAADVQALPDTTLRRELTFGFGLYDLPRPSLQTLAAVFDLEGQLYIGFRVDLSHELWRADSTGWMKEDVPDLEHEAPALAVAPDGRVHLLDSTFDDLLHYVKGAEGWTSARFPAASPVKKWLMFGDDGRAIAAYDNSVVDLTTGDVLWESLNAIDDAAHGGGIVAVVEDHYFGPRVVIGRGSPPVFEAIDAPPTEERAMAPSLAITSKGEVVMAYLAASGIGVSRLVDNEWVPLLLDTAEAKPRLHVLPDDRLELYYYADTDWDGYDDELRRLRQGSCAP